MDEDVLERRMMRFWDRDADVLVSTTIIESGLDVPSANTLVVDRADRLGLAQMYQLRGRVGRSTERAFAYFFFPPAQSLTEEAHERLLKESIAEMKGEPLPEEREIRIDLPVRAFVPVGWVGQEALRLELYRNIATAADHERLDEVRGEAEDRFGQLPAEVRTLLAVASLRITCDRLGVTKVPNYRDVDLVEPLA